MAASDAVEPEALRLSADGGFPNHPEWPALIYRGALSAAGSLADAFERRFGANGWGGCWRWGVFAFDHFHSNAHEALGVARGSARLRLGGPRGPRVDVRSGDLLVLPAGTAHCNEGDRDGFQVVGAYPEGQRDDDLRRGDPSAFEAALRAIRATPLPRADPLCGAGGPLLRLWGAG